jgi:Leucine-rich repeat (LRR) protein
MSASITAINCGTSSPKLGGTIDISDFPNLQQFICNNNDITAISGYENNANLTTIQFLQNKVTGVIPPLSGLSNLQEFRCGTNQLTGPIPSLSELSNLRFFGCGVNQLTGPIPSLSELNNLRVFNCDTNQFTGPIPSLSGLSNLQEFRCFTNQLTGPIPSLSELSNLREFRCGTNQLTGPIPSLSGLSNLQVFGCSINELTGFDGGSVSITLGNFQAQNNQLTSTAVNAILAAFVAANKTAGTRIINLGGTGNAAPTGQGLVDKQTLLDRGWRTATGSTAITN